MESRQKILRDWIKHNFKVPANMNNTRRVQDIDLVRFFEHANPEFVVSPEEIRDGFRGAGFKVNESLDLGYVVSVGRADYRAALRRFLQ